MKRKLTLFVTAISLLNTNITFAESELSLSEAIIQENDTYDEFEEAQIEIDNTYDAEIDTLEANNIATLAEKEILTYQLENGYYSIKNFSILKSTNEVDNTTLSYIKSIDVATLNGENFLVLTFDETNPVFTKFTTQMTVYYKDAKGEYQLATVTKTSEKGSNIQFKFPISSISSLIEFKYSYSVAELNMASSYERSIYIDGSTAVKTRDVTEDEFVFDTNTADQNQLTEDKKYIVDISANTNIIKTESLLLEKTSDGYLLTLIINNPNSKVSGITFNNENLTYNYSNSNVISVDVKLDDLTSEKTITINYTEGTSQKINFTLDKNSISEIPATYQLDNGYYSIPNFSILKSANEVDKTTLGYIKSIDVATLNGESFLVLTFDETNPVFTRFTTQMTVYYKDAKGEYQLATVTKTSEKGSNIQFKFPISSISPLIEFKYSYSVVEMNMSHSYDRSIYIDGSTAVKTGDVTKDEFVFDTNTNTDTNINSPSNNTNNSSSSSSNTTTLNRYNLPDGTYSVEIDLWNAETDVASMGNDAIYRNAILKVENGNYKLSFSTKPMKLGIYSAVLKGVLVLNSNGEYEEATVVSSNHSLAGETNLPSAFSIVLPNKGEEYTNIRILTKFDPYFPGHEDLKARLKINWSTLRSDSSATLTEYKSTESDKITYLLDTNTGIKVTPNNEDTFNNVSLEINVSETDNNIYDLLVDMGEEAEKFIKYDFKLKKGEEQVSLSDVFTVSIPVPENFDIQYVDLYRLNDDNSLTLITSEVEGNALVFKTSTLTTFVLVEKSEITHFLEAEETEELMLYSVDDKQFVNDFETHYAKQSIDFVKEVGILVGKSENEFAPNESLNVAMLITAISRMEQIDNEKYSSSDNDSYYDPAINWAKEVGGILSDSDLSNPNKCLTREEAITIINRYIEFKGIELKQIYSLTFNDDEKISEWAKQSIYTLAKAGIITGRENFIFAPQEFATRAEFAIILEKIMKSYF